MMTALLCSVILAAAAPPDEALSPPPLPLSEFPTAALPRPIRGGRGVERFEFTGQPVLGFHLETSMRKSLLIPGSVMLGVGWLFTGISGISINSLAFVPFVGAFSLTAQAASNSVRGGFTATLGAFAVAMFVTAGVVQLAGAALVALAVATQQQWLERDLGEVHVAIVPSPSGANVIGRF